MSTTPHATTSRCCSSATSVRCAGRGITSATVSATAARNATRKNQILLRNTGRSLLHRLRERRHLRVHLDLALADVHVGSALEPAVLVEDLELVAALGDV